MATTISFGNYKGGVGKTTTSAVTSYLLAKQAKVLTVDFDSQANCSETLLQRDIAEFSGRTVYEACMAGDAKPYIIEITPQLHVLPADDALALLPKQQPHLLQRALEPVLSAYDYVIIDMPPALGEHTTNALTASDATVVTTTADPYSFRTAQRYMDTIEATRAINPKLKTLGILFTVFDPRAKVDREVEETMRLIYKEAVFQTTIKKRMRIKEFSMNGISDRTKDDKRALQPFEEFIEELKQRV